MCEYDFEQISAELERLNDVDTLSSDDLSFVKGLRELSLKGEVRLGLTSEMLVRLLGLYADKYSPLLYQERIRQLVQGSLAAGLPFPVLGRFFARCREQRSMDLSVASEVSGISSETLRNFESSAMVFWELPTRRFARLIDFLEIEREFFLRLCRKLDLHDLPLSYTPSTMMMRRPARYERETRRIAEDTQRKLIAEYARNERDKFLNELCNEWGKSTLESM